MVTVAEASASVTPATATTAPVATPTAATAAGGSDEGASAPRERRRAWRPWPDGWRPPVAWCVVAVVVAWLAWALRAELHPGHMPNDGSFHLAYLRVITDRLAAGDSPLDGVFPSIGVGFPVFLHYQVLPYLIVAPFAWLFGAYPAYTVSLFLLLALWPIAVYATARLVELDRWAAAGAAVAAPLVMNVHGYGFELNSYVWRGSGMWTQAWGMWFATLGLGCAWRALYRDRSRALPAGLLAAALCSHLLTGLFALAIVAVWVVAGPGRRAVLARRAAVIVAVMFVASLWLLVPTLVDRGATRFQNPDGTFWRDSFGVRRVLSDLATGDVFDAGRAPVLTAAVAVGLVVAVASWAGRWGRLPGPVPRETGAALVAGFAVSLALYCGTTLVGPVVDRLPAREVLFLHRAVVGVHLAGVLLAGAGAATAGRAVLAGARRWVPAGPARRLAPVAVVAVAVAVVWPAWRHVDRFLSESGTWVAEQRAYESSDGTDLATLVGVAQARGGRVWAGTRGPGDAYKVGFVPGYIEVVTIGAPAVGFSGRVPSLTEPAEAVFNGDSAAMAEAFDVRWQVRAADAGAPPGGRLVAQRGRHVLWEMPTSGPVMVIDTTPAIATSRDGLGTAIMPFLASTMPLDARYPLLALDGADPPAPTLPPGTPAGSSPGAVVSAEVQADGNRYVATVDAERDAAVLVKTAYHPRWEVEVDGRPADAVLVAPGLLAVEVPAGRHQVEASFAGFPRLPRVGLVLLGVAALAGLAVSDRRRSARRHT